MDIAKLQEFFRNGTYILGPYMEGFENTGRDERFWNGTDSSITDSIEVSPYVFGQWLMNAKTIQVTTNDVTGVYGRIFGLSPENFFFSDGPATFILENIGSPPIFGIRHSEAGFPTAEDYWGLFGNGNWYGVNNLGNESFRPVDTLSCVHKYGRFFFNNHISDNQQDLKFVSASAGRIKLEGRVDEDGNKWETTINMLSTFF